MIELGPPINIKRPLTNILSCCLYPPFTPKTRHGDLYRPLGTLYVHCNYLVDNKQIEGTGGPSRTIYRKQQSNIKGSFLGVTNKVVRKWSTKSTKPYSHSWLQYFSGSNS